MALRGALLIALWLVLAPAGAAAQPRCLGCHGVHYGREGTCVGCHRGNDRTERVEIAHHDLIPGRYSAFRIPGSAAVEEGRKLLDRLACRRCHVIGGSGNRLATDLDRSFPANTPEELASALDTPALHMPQFHLAEADVDRTVNTLLFFAVRAPPRGAEVPQVIHFGGEGERREDPFTRHCGGCHKALTVALGGLGSGDAGPNLSGLLSEFHPPVGQGLGPWTRQRLGRWISNPREVRPFARMRPVPLEAPELARLIALLESSPSPAGAADGAPPAGH